MKSTKQAKQGERAQHRRYHRRLPMSVPINVDVGDNESIRVQNQDISWGGARFVIPKRALPESESVTMTFPWTNGEKFCANAEIVRKDDLDDERAVVAARFSSLSTVDQRRLEKLLHMLQGIGDGTDRRTEPLVPVLEVLFSDADEIRAKLGEIAEGHLSVIVFEAYEERQSIRLVLGGIADQPALRLRARVTRVQLLTTETDSAWPMYNVTLQFEHPMHELQVAARTLLEHLPEERLEQQETSAATETGRR